MSLCIDSRYITGIFALGQWFKVQKGTVDVDAFEFTNWEEDDPHSGSRNRIQHTDYILGSLYPETTGECGRYADGSPAYYSPPAGHVGITFTDADTGERVSFSMMEVRAFREVRK